MNNKTIEGVVGIFVLIGFLSLGFLAFSVGNGANRNNGDTYTLLARFKNSGGLNDKSSVTMAGVPIGRVSNIEIDKSRFSALITMEIQAKYDNIPIDSSASILTSGLLGAKYIGIDPGGDVLSLEDGSEIQFTQSSLVLEKLISTFLFNDQK